MTKNKIILCFALALVLVVGTEFGAAKCAQAEELTVASAAIVQVDNELAKTQKQVINKINRQQKNRIKYLSEKNNKTLEKIKKNIKKSKSITFINNQYKKASKIFEQANKVKKARNGFVKNMQAYQTTYKKYTTKKIRKLIKKYIKQSSNIYSAKTLLEWNNDIWQRCRKNISIPMDYNLDDWSWDKILFVEEWGNNNYWYLSNKWAFGTQSPMKDYSWDIAEAAWYYGIDPRLCAAISWSESGCGVACWAPYNAWGWICNAPAMYSWSDGIWKWSEFFANYFGSYLTYSGAVQYSGGVSSWYSFIMGEANQIGNY